VQVALSRREQTDPTARSNSLAGELARSGQLAGALRIPHTVGDLDVVADLRTGRCTVGVDLAAPTEGRSSTRVNWLVRQLGDAPSNLRIDAFAHMARTSTSELLGAVRQDPAKLLADPKADLRRFKVSATSQLGTKRTTGRGAFIDSVLGAIDGFYEAVLQDLRPWVAKAPQVSKSGSVLADAGIDTSVLPGAQPVDDELGPSDVEPRPGKDVTAGPEPIVSRSEDLVSWGEAEAHIEQERTEGVPSDVPNSSWSPPVPPVDSVSATNEHGENERRADDASADEVAGN
jgi:hypothetical protein